MPIIDAMISELTHEATLTRKTLERVPEGKLDWRPHPKSFTMGKLASHLAELTDWVIPTLTLPELDMATTKHEPFHGSSVAAILAHFDQSLTKTLAAMKDVSDAHLMVPWTLRTGDKVYLSMPRVAVLRGMVMNHAIHHRAQLGVYLRLNDVPLPSIYGPSADEGR
jgi:uncharacterized damage-inducible protein DinB